MKHDRLTPHATTVGLLFAAVVIAGLLSTSTGAHAEINVRIDIGNAPPPPRIVFVSPPHERRYSDSPIFVVDDPRAGDYDCFRYSGYYWVFQDGYWYRAVSWRGPFAVCDPRIVPAVFYRQPPARWKHRPSGPPVFSRQPERRAPMVMPRHDRQQQPMDRHPSVVAPVRRPDVSRPPPDQHRGEQGSVAPAKHGDRTPPGQAKKGNSGSPGKGNKGDKGKGNDKGNDKGGGHGGK